MAAPSGNAQVLFDSGRMNYGRLPMVIFGALVSGAMPAQRKPAGRPGQPGGVAILSTMYRRW